MSLPCAGAALPDQFQPAAPSQPSVLTTKTAAAVITVDHSTNGVHLNFRGASLSQVLDCLSEEAGFIINRETEVRGTVEMWSKGSVTREEVVELLNAVLVPRGCTVIRISTVDRKSTRLNSSHLGI